MTGPKYGMQRMLLWSFLILRSLGLAPYVNVNGRCKKSQVYMGIGIAIQTVVFSSAAYGLIEMINIFPVMKSEVYTMALWLYAPFYNGMMMLVSFHFITSSAHVVRIVRYLNGSSTSPKSVSKSQYILAALIVITTCQLLYSAAMSKYASKKLMHSLLVTSGQTLIQLCYLGLPFILYSLMKLLAVELRQSTSLFLIQKHNRFSDTHKYLAKRTEELAEPDLANVRISVMKIRRAAIATHKAFSGVVLGAIVFGQYQVVLAVLFALLNRSRGNSAVTALFFTFPTALQLYLLLDSQTEYLKVCEERVKRVRKLTAAAGQMGPQNWKAVWQLHAIKAELKSMPRFFVFGLFELSRRCLLSMGSIALTYVIIAVQFTTSNSPVTCKAFAATANLSAEV
ncbi:Gustatory receptor 42 [Hyalella azteca]|uniref:Gustatory receptor 42 n=1 Tax=Hyalella azteca TaxID=294128 RepID=A0A6A0HCC2_HYAAZ|nr:Gustatory receptor 42 [Hyalella azteca]